MMDELGTKIHSCPTHGIDYPVDTRMVGSSEIRFGVCPECHADKLRRASDAKTLEILGEINQHCRIEPLFATEALWTFKAVTKAQKQAVAGVERLISGDLNHLLLLGPHGTGKTHLAVSAVREKFGEIWTMYELSGRIRASYTPGARETELDVVGRLARIPILAIDEIGRTRGGEWEANWLTHIVDKRYSRGLPTMFVSNNHPRLRCLHDGCEKCIENYLGSDIASRLLSRGLTVILDGEDFRRGGSKK